MSQINHTETVTKINRKVNQHSYTWWINNFSFLREDVTTHIESPPFLSSNRESWHLRLYPHHNHQNANFYVIHLYRTGFDGEKLFKYEFSLSVSDKNNEKRISRKFQTKYMKFSGSAGWWQVNLEDLYCDKVSKLLPDDTLKITCDLTFVTYPRINYEHVNIADFEKSQSCVNKNKWDFLEQLFLEEKFSDIKLVTSCGKELKAHRNILAARSPKFETAFEKAVKAENNSVEIKDVKHDVLKEMLRYIYTDRIENIETIATELFIASNDYKIDDLKIECSKYIANNITVESSIEILEMADKFNASELKEHAKRFIKLNIAEVIKTDVHKFKMQALGSLAEVFQSFLQ